MVQMQLMKVALYIIIFCLPNSKIINYNNRLYYNNLLIANYNDFINRTYQISYNYIAGLSSGTTAYTVNISNIVYALVTIQVWSNNPYAPLNYYGGVTTVAY